MSKEFIVALNRDELVNDLLKGIKNKIVYIDTDLLNDFIESESVFLERTKELEQNKNIIQVIPSIMITHKDFVYVTKRLKQQTEKRLHNKYSLFVGGHMEKQDMFNGMCEYMYCYHLAAEREMNEELNIGGMWSAKTIGVLYTDEEEVSSVHLCVLLNVEVDKPKVYVKEKDKHIGMWIPKCEVGMFAKEHEFEGWAKIIYEHFKDEWEA